MNASELVSYLLNSCGSLQEFDCYIFGSSLSGVGSDFDILIVGPSGETLLRLKKELRKAGEELPLDIIYMLPEELYETDFIKCKGCVSFAELSRQVML